MAGGRPSKYEPAFCDAVMAAGKEGQSKAEIAATLDVTRETLNEWAKVHPEFSDALHRAQEYSLAWWEGRARQNLTTTGFQAGLWKQAMSGRFPAEPYRERQEVNLEATHSAKPAELSKALSWISESLGGNGGAAD